MSQIDNSKIVSNDANDTTKNFKGTIVKYIHGRNFGFIKTSKSENTETREIFFHKSNVIKSKFEPKIKVGDKCEFNIKSEEKGNVATNINIYYRPIPRKSKMQKHLDNVQQENNLTISLFSQIIMDCFHAATTSNK